MDDDFVPAAYFKAFCTWIVVWRAWNSTVTSTTDKWDFFFSDFFVFKSAEQYHNEVIVFLLRLKINEKVHKIFICLKYDKYT